MAEFIRRRLEKRNQTVDDAVIPTGSQSGVDRDLLWTITGISCLVAGLGALLLPVILNWCTGVLDYGLSGFIWRNNPLTVFEMLILLLAALVPFSLIGFLIRCVHQLGCPSGRWNFGVLGWVLAGTAFGFLITALLVRFPSNGLLVMRFGAVPLLVAAMVSVWTAVPGVKHRRSGGEEMLLNEPEIGERWPVVLRMAVFVCVCATVADALLWVYVVGTLRGTSSGFSDTLLAGGGMLWAGSIGIWIASKRMLLVRHRIGSLGTHCVISGVLLAAGVAVFNIVVRSSCPTFRDTPGFWLLWAICAFVPFVAVTHAVGYGGIAVLRRSAYFADTGSAVLRMMLVAVGISFLFVALCLIELLGSYATLVAAALALLATGGILVIHEPSYVSGPSRAGTALVFTAVLAMTWFMPQAGGGWLRDQQVSRGRLLESWSLTCDVRSEGELRFIGDGGSGEQSLDESAISKMADICDWSSLPSNCRVGAISLLGDDSNWVPLDFPGQVERLLVEPSMWWRINSLRLDREVADSVAGKVRYRLLPAIRSLRASSDTYDLLLITFRDMPYTMSRRVLASDFFERALPRLAPDGVMVAMFSHDECPVEASQRLIAEFSRYPNSYVNQIEPVIGGDRCDVFVCGTGAVSHNNAGQWLEIEDGSLSPVSLISKVPITRSLSLVSRDR